MAGYMNAGRAASGNWRGLTGERTGGAAACLVGVAILALAVWGGVTRAEGGTACPDPIKIALTTSMTTDMALLGVQARNGLQLAVDELNAGKGIAGKKIHLTVEDNAASSTTALNALNRVVGGNPLVISPHLFTQSDVIKREELPFIIAGTNAGLTAQGIPWLFRIHVHDGQLADLTPRYVVEQLKKTKPAIIAVADDFGLGASKGIQATLAELKVKPVAVESYAPTDKDMSAQLLNIKNKGADIVMIWGRPADVTIVLKQMKQLGITTPKIGNASIVAKTTLDNLSDEEADGAMAFMAANLGIVAYRRPAQRRSSRTSRGGSRRSSRSRRTTSRQPTMTPSSCSRRSSKRWAATGLPSRTVWPRPRAGRG